MKISNLFSVFIFFYVLFIPSCGDLTGEGDKFPAQRTYSEIYSMNVDGTGSTKLTSDKNSIIFMQYLPKSDKILFVQDGGTYIMNSDGTQRSLLSTKRINKSAEITQDEQTLYFVESEVSGLKVNTILYSLSISTGGIKLILQDSSWIVSGGIGISLDGLQLLYCSYLPRPNTSALYLVNALTLEKRKIKEWTNNLYCLFPQFVPNSNQILFFDKIDSNRNDAYIRVMDLVDTSPNKILDTVSIYYEYFSPVVNSKGDIFYGKNGMTVLNVITNQKTSVSSAFFSEYGFASWSYDETRFIFTDNLHNQFKIYNLSDGSAINTIQGGEYPHLNFNNTKIFYTASFTETTYE